MRPGPVEAVFGLLSAGGFGFKSLRIVSTVSPPSALASVSGSAAGSGRGTGCGIIGSTGSDMGGSPAITVKFFCGLQPQLWSRGPSVLR